MAETDWSQGWHYSSGVGQEGPVAATQLVSLHLKKQVRPEDQVWHPGLPDWCTLREAWPKLRPFKEELKASRSGRSGARSAARPRSYRVVEVGSVTAHAVQDVLMKQVAEGFTYDSPIVLGPDRTLLVFKK